MEAVMRRMEEVLQMHMQGIREEIAGLKREIREQEKQKEEEGLKTQIQSNLGEHEILEKKPDEANVKNADSMKEATEVKIQRSEEDHARSPPDLLDMSSSMEGNHMPLTMKLGPKVVLTNAPSMTAEIEEKKITGEGMKGKQGGNQSHAIVRVWVSRTGLGLGLGLGLSG